MKYSLNLQKKTLLLLLLLPVPVASGLRRRSAAARLMRSWVRIPPGAWMFVCCECCVLSGRGLCVELITRPEESYWLWCVVFCDLETLRMRRPWPALGSNATAQKNYYYYYYYYYYYGGTRWRSWLRHCATSRKVAGSIPDGVIRFFHWHNPSGRAMALGLTQPLTEMSTRNVSCR